jgi:hypothetical protein
MPELDDQIFGECQALLLNFETLLKIEFGDKYSLNESLANSLQFSAITPAGKMRAIRKFQSQAYSNVNEYVRRFRSSLSSEVNSSMEYSYKVFLLPKIGNHAKSADLAVEFIDVSQLNERDIKEYEKIVTLLKTRERLGLFRKTQFGMLLQKSLTGIDQFLFIPKYGTTRRIVLLKKCLSEFIKVGEAIIHHTHPKMTSGLFIFLGIRSD